MASERTQTSPELRSSDAVLVRDGELLDAPVEHNLADAAVTDAVTVEPVVIAQPLGFMLVAERSNDLTDGVVDEPDLPLHQEPPTVENLDRANVTHPAPESEQLVHVPGAQRTLAETLENPDLTLARAVATYILYKRRRLTEASERSYTAILNEFTKHHPGARLHDFEPPRGTITVEEFLTARWGHLAERTYNRSLSVLSDFFQWHVVRGTLIRDPVAGLERAKARPVYRITFTRAQVDQIFATNPEPRDQIALRLLLHYAIRKGALRGVQLQHFDHDKRRLVIFTKFPMTHAARAALRTTRGVWGDL